MNKARVVIKYENIGVYLLFVAAFRPYFISSVTYQSIKAIAVMYVLIYVTTKMKRIPLINLSVAVSFSIILSSIINSWSSGNVSWRMLVDAIIYGMMFYDFYTLFQYYEATGRVSVLTKCLLNINFVYCFISLIFLNYSVGTVINDKNLSQYLFGNKFGVCYLFIQLVALFYICYAETIRKRLFVRVVFALLIIVSFFVSAYYGCVTALFANTIPPFVFLNPKGIRNVLYKPPFIMLTIIVTTMMPFFLEGILLNQRITSFVVNTLHRTISLSGRMNIYSRFIVPLIMKRPYFGYGYGNNAMKSASFYYTNAQNGLLEHVLRYGIFGGAVMVFFIIYCFLKIKQSLKSDGAVMAIYAMLVASIVEVSYNWVLFIGLALLTVVGEKKNSNKKHHHIQRKMKPIRLRARRL